MALVYVLVQMLALVKSLDRGIGANWLDLNTYKAS